MQNLRIHTLDCILEVLLVLIGDDKNSQNYLGLPCSVCLPRVGSGAVRIGPNPFPDRR